MYLGLGSQRGQAINEKQSAKKSGKIQIFLTVEPCRLIAVLRRGLGTQFAHLNRTLSKFCYLIHELHLTNRQHCHHSISDYFCLISKDLAKCIPNIPNPLINAYINTDGSHFHFKEISSTNVQRAMGKQSTKSLGNNKISSFFIKLAFYCILLMVHVSSKIIFITKSIRIQGPPFNRVFVIIRHRRFLFTTICWNDK